MLCHVSFPTRRVQRQQPDLTLFQQLTKTDPQGFEYFHPVVWKTIPLSLNSLFPLRTHSPHSNSFYDDFVLNSFLFLSGSSCVMILISHTKLEWQFYLCELTEMFKCHFVDFFSVWNFRRCWNGNSKKQGYWNRLPEKHAWLPPVSLGGRVIIQNVLEGWFNCLFSILLQLGTQFSFCDWANGYALLSLLEKHQSKCWFQVHSSQKMRVKKKLGNFQQRFVHPSFTLNYREKKRKRERLRKRDSFYYSPNTHSSLYWIKLIQKPGSTSRSPVYMARIERPGR